GYLFGALEDYLPSRCCSTYDATGEPGVKRYRRKSRQGRFRERFRAAELGASPDMARLSFHERRGYSFRPWHSPLVMEAASIFVRFRTSKLPLEFTRSSIP